MLLSDFMRGHLFESTTLLFARQIGQAPCFMFSLCRAVKYTSSLTERRTSLALRQPPSAGAHLGNSREEQGTQSSVL